jgi:hypothetical protein
VRWSNVGQNSPRQFQCGYCDFKVGSDKGYYYEHNSNWRIYICPSCHKPSFFENDKQTPGIAYGNKVESLPEDIKALYEEARYAISVKAFTGTVMLCRKILMNIAVGQKAPTGQTFMQYVEYLASNGFIPPNGKHWVDHIRKKGNEANHDIIIMSETDAKELISFVEMLLKFIYEFPSKIPTS